MFDEMFNVFIYNKIDGKINKVKQGVFRVIGDIGIENFKHEIFNYACDGYVVEIERYEA